MKGIQRIISGWLAVCLMISMLPMQVFAVEDTANAPAAATEIVTEPSTETTAAQETEVELVSEETVTTVSVETTVPTEESTIPETVSAAETTEAMTEETVASTEKTTAATEEEEQLLDEESEATTIVLEDVVLKISQAAMMSGVEYISEEAAVLQLREYLKQRNTEFTIYVQATGFEAESFWNSLYEQAIAHTGNPTEGDYILNHLNRFTIDFTWDSVDGIDYITVNCKVGYFSSSEQEAELDAAYASVMEGLALSGKTDYQKVCSIYHYITANITYDYANKEDDTCFVKQTAYGALVNKTCVCQGYANLFYRMALDAGLDCRIITGSSHDERHAWNIVCIDGSYYNVDSTWDAEYAQQGYDYAYFLKSDSSFRDHVRDEQYLEDTFTTQYPISTTDKTEGNLTDQKEGYFTYSVTNGRATLTKYTGLEKNVVVPATLGGYPVYCIGTGAFTDTSNGRDGTIETITFSEGIVTVEPENIKVCPALKSVHYPSTLRIPYTSSTTGMLTIFPYSPAYCYALETITVAEENPYMVVVDNVLYSKDMKTLIRLPTNDPREVLQIPEEVEFIDSGACGENINLKEVIMPDTVEYIGYWAFNNCQNLENINISEGCTVIGQYAFNGTNITSYHIPAATTVILDGAFGQENREMTITVDKDNPVYYAVDNVLFAKLEDGISSILIRYPVGSEQEEYAIPKGVTYIGMEAFTDAKHLKRLYFPDGLNSIAKNLITENSTGSCFNSCNNLIIYYPLGSDVWPQEDYVTYKLYSYDSYLTWRSCCVEEHTYDNSQDPTCNACEFTRYEEFYDYIAYGACGQSVDWVLKTDGTLMIVGSGNMHDYPDIQGMLPWSQYADQIKVVQIESGVTNICRSAFYEGSTYHYDNIKSVSLPDSVTSVGHAAFSGCQGIEKITIPGNNVNIDRYAFWFCDNLTEITISGNNVSIGEGAFGLSWDSSNKGRMIHFEGDAPRITDDAFMNVTVTAFYPADNDTWTSEVMQNYGGNITWVASCNEHKIETIPAQEATCTENGLTEGKKCSVCGTVTVAQQTIKAKGHTYTDDQDATCNICGENREVEIPSVPMYRLYNPYTLEHLLTADAAEKDLLVSAGWSLDGVAWDSPNDGELVYRLYNPYDDWHTYSMNQAEIDMLVPLGWKVDGVVCRSATEAEGKPVYRLFNPYEQKNYHLLTASEEELAFLTGLGWTLDGVAWYCLED